MALIGLLDLTVLVLLILVFSDQRIAHAGGVLAWFTSIGLLIFGPPIL